MNKSKKAIIYIRVSTDKQVNEGNSLDVQEEELLNYAKRNNIEILDIFREKGESGKNENRTELNKMLFFVQQNDVDLLLVHTFDRLSRSLLGSLKIAEELEQSGVYSYFYQDGVDTSTDAGKLHANILASIAENERRSILRRTHGGSIRNAAKGNWNGGRTFGYKSENKELIIMEDEAEAVKEIFDMYTNKGYGYKKIAGNLNTRGIKTLRDRKFAGTTIKRILRNALYKGLIVWTSGEGTKNEETIEVQGNHEPIISAELWDKTHEVLKVRGRTNNRKYHGRNFLTGVLQCATCGGKTEGHRSGNHRYYRCSDSQQKGSTVCTTNAVRADVIEKEVMERLKGLILNKGVINSIVNNINKDNKVDTGTIDKKIKKHEANIKNISKNRHEQFEKKLRGEITDDEMYDFLEFLSNKKEKEEEEIKKCKLLLVESTSKIEASKVRDILSSSLEGADKLTGPEKNQLVLSLVESITINKGNSPSERTLKDINLYFNEADIASLFVGSDCSVRRTISNHIVIITI